MALKFEVQALCCVVSRLRDGHRVGAHAVARDAAGGVGGVEEGQPSSYSLIFKFIWNGLVATGSTIVVLLASLQTASAGSEPGPVAAPQKLPEALTTAPVLFCRPQLPFPKMLLWVILMPVTLPVGLLKSKMPGPRLPRKLLRRISSTAPAETTEDSPWFLLPLATFWVN